MAIEFKVPELGEGVDSAEVAQIHVSEGDTIEADQNILELETEKAVADLPCPHAGKVAKIHVAKGDTIQIGQTILTIEEAETSSHEEQDDEKPDDRKSADETPAEEEPADETPSEESDGQKKPAETSKQKEKPVADDEGSAEGDEGDEEGEDEDEEEGEDEDEGDDEEEDGQDGSDEEEEDDENEDEGDGEDEDGEVTAELDEDQEADERVERKKESPRERRKSKKKPADKAAVRAEGADSESAEPPLPAGPATRRLAKKLDIDLHEVQGSGPRGRIRPEDVVAAHDRQRAQKPSAAPSRTELPDFSRWGPVEEQPLNKIARSAAQRLTTSWATIPHVTQHDVADITELDDARRRYHEADRDSSPKVTLTAIALKAVAAVLQEFPRFNSSLNETSDALILKRYYHLGVAVDTEQGLLVPVIRDVDRKTIVQLAAELSEMADKARHRKLSLEQMRGATFTVSNQGGIGGTAFTPIVSHPQVAILGISRAQPQVKMIEGQPRERLMLPLSLSYDHRVINGADAARFMARLSTELSSCFQLMIRS